MAFDDPIVWIIILIPLVLIGFVALIVYVAVKVAKAAWGNKPTTRSASSVPIQSNNSQPNSRDTKFCIKCGTKIPKSAVFCPACGTQQIVVS